MVFQLTAALLLENVFSVCRSCIAWWQQVLLMFLFSLCGLTCWELLLALQRNECWKRPLGVPSLTSSFKQDQFRSGFSEPFTTNELLANSWPSQKGWQVFYSMAMYSSPTIQGEAEAWGQGMQRSNYSGWMGSCSCRLPVGAALSSHLTMQQVHSDSGGFRFRRRANLTCSVFAGVCKEWE